MTKAGNGEQVFAVSGDGSTGEGTYELREVFRTIEGAREWLEREGARPFPPPRWQPTETEEFWTGRYSEFYKIEKKELRS